MFKLFIRDLTMKSLSHLQIYYRLNIFFKKAVWIHYEFNELTMNLLSASRIHSIFFLNALWTHYLKSGFNMNRLSFSLIHYESVIFFLNVLWIHHESLIFFATSQYLYLEFTMDLRFVSQIHDWYITFFAISLIFHVFSDNLLHK